ncbi:MAG: ABC transporter permease [Oscillospiraceae bacterium]|nr:ABC transporter permease [Oscillospiraceae bacterium]
MTAQSSTDKKVTKAVTVNFSKFGAYYLHKLKSLRTMMILNSIFALLSYPFISGSMLAYTNAYLYRQSLPPSQRYGALDSVDTLSDIFQSSIFVGFLMMAAMFFMSYLITAKSFRWLYRKNVVDMDYSLPISGDTRFFGDLLATFTGVLLPHLIAIIISTVLYNMVDFAALEGSEHTASLFTVIGPQLMWTGFFVCVMFIASSLFVMSLCGRAAEARIYPFAMSLAVTLIHGMCMLLMISGSYGFSSSGLDGNTNITDTMAVSSPLGMLWTTLMYFLYGRYYNNSVQTPLFRAGIFVPALVIVLLLFAGAFLIIRYRRAERVGSPFVFRGVRTALPALVIFAIVTVFSIFILPSVFGTYDNVFGGYQDTSQGTVVAMVIVTFVVYVVMELISGKGFKKFWLTCVKYLAALGGSLVLCIGIFLAGGIGMWDRVPAADGVASVEFLVNTSFAWTENHMGTVCEKENIEVVTQVHRDILNSPRCYENNYYINLYYTLSDGTSSTRRYCVTQEQHEKYVRMLVSPEAFYNEYEAELDRIDRITSVRREYDSRLYDVDITGEQLREAYRKDAELVDYDKLFGKQGSLKVSVKLDCMNVAHDEPEVIETYTWRMTLYPWCVNTLALLEGESGADLSTMHLEDFRTVILTKGSRTGNSKVVGQDPVFAFYKSGDTTFTVQEYYDYMRGDMFYAPEIVYEDEYTDGQSDIIAAMNEAAVRDYGCVIIPRGDERTEKLFSGAGTMIPPDSAEGDYYELTLLHEGTVMEFSMKYNDILTLYVAPQDFAVAEEMYAEFNKVIPLETGG